MSLSYPKELLLHGDSNYEHNGSTNNVYFPLQHFSLRFVFATMSTFIHDAYLILERGRLDRDFQLHCTSSWSSTPIGAYSVLLLQDRKSSGFPARSWPASSSDEQSHISGSSTLSLDGPSLDYWQRPV
jgi:hypothetical protein